MSEDNKKDGKDGGKKKSILGALGKKAFEFAKENPSAAAAAGAFVIIGGIPATVAAGVLASKPVRDKLGNMLPEGASDAVKGAAKKGFDEVNKIKKELEDTLGQDEAPEAQAPKKEEKPTQKPRRKGPKGLGPDV
jgi:hypothetical protein